MNKDAVYHQDLRESFVMELMVHTEGGHFYLVKSVYLFQIGIGFRGQEHFFAVYNNFLNLLASAIQPNLQAIQTWLH